MKKTLVTCDCCGEHKFYTMKQPRFFTGYECFHCAKDADQEAYEAVAIPEMSFTPLSIENWYYFDKRLILANLALETEKQNSSEAKE